MLILHCIGTAVLVLASALMAGSALGDMSAWRELQAVIAVILGLSAVILGAHL